MTYSDIPDDENGDVLRRMQARGEDLSLARIFNFSLVFPTESRAQGFVAKAREMGLDATLEDETTDEGLFDVTVDTVMVPVHAEIGNFERALEIIAEGFDGRNDGWGCYIPYGDT